MVRYNTSSLLKLFRVILVKKFFVIIWSKLVYNKEVFLVSFSNIYYLAQKISFWKLFKLFKININLGFDI